MDRDEQWRSAPHEPLPGPELRTPRLLLRRWIVDDLAPFADMNADAEVMKYFISTLTSDESNSLVRRYEDHFERQGFGRWAVQEAKSGAFIGAVGIQRIEFDAPFTPAVEIGWRLSRRFWGFGFATEAARTVLEFAFLKIQLSEVVAFTPIVNARSREVMHRIGMREDVAARFYDTRLDPGHPLAENTLYRSTNTSWSASNEL
jgi:RimJ/RimL family protein N-acetyltransferase